MRNHLGGILAFEPTQVFRQQGRAHAAQARSAVTGRAMLAVDVQ
jgi:hypothetical protein